MPERPPPSLLRARAFAALAVLAPALGGGTELWANGALLLATAVVLIAFPPRRGPGRLWLALAVALIAAAAAAFFPAAWFGIPAWRRLVIESFEVPLSPMLSPQPWLSLEGTGHLLAAIVFAAALWAHDWSRTERHAAVRLYVLGMLILAGLAVGSLTGKWHVPWWPLPGNSGIGFGFFPNRNQTANVLALAGIMVTALGFEALSRHRRTGYGWFAGLVLIGTALVIAYSRAGIVLFFCGAAGWVAWSLRFSASRKGATLGFAAVIVLLAGFFLFGGETLKRFEQQARAPGADYRLVVQRDAWRLAAEQPWLGHGLGNFEPLFALTRFESVKQSRALHPESDWLWGAVELGWPAMALLAAGLVLWFVETLLFASGTDRYLRSAATVGGAAFALHGLVDVSAHRSGALWPALLLFALARNPSRAPAASAAAAWGFRAAAAALAGFGLWWVISARWPEKFPGAPTSATLAAIEARLERENAAADYPAMLATAGAALRIAPLDWNFYYQRAVAHAATPGGLEAAVRDFDRARFLEPSWVELCLGEGRVWLALEEPQLAIDAWTEALRRAGRDAPQFFPQMLAAGWNRMTVRTELARLARTNVDLLAAYLDQARGLEFDVEAARLLERDPDLKAWTAPQRKLLFGSWFRNGDRDPLIALIAAHPEWQEDAWLGLAQYYAQRRDFERAWHFVARFGPTPALPHLVSGQSLAELERAFHFHPDAFQEGLALFTALRSLRQVDEALSTLRIVNGIPGRPNYVPFLEAELWAEKGEWEKAWDAWSRFFAGIKAG